MRKLLLTFGAVFAAAATSTQAQVNPLQSVWDELTVSTNFALVGFYGRGLEGNKSVAGGDYVYNLSHNPTANAALVIGGDFLWAKGTNDANSIRGGLNLNAKIYPLKNFGVTNFYGTVFGFDTIANPVNNPGAPIGNVVGTGVDFKWNIYKAIDWHIGGFYSNRTGQGRWNGNYANIMTAFSWKF